VIIFIAHHGYAGSLLVKDENSIRSSFCFDPEYLCEIYNSFETNHIFNLFHSFCFIFYIRLTGMGRTALYKWMKKYLNKK